MNMRVYVVIAEDYEKINLDDDCSQLVREVYGIYLSEASADAARVEAKMKHDHAFVEVHNVE